MSIIKKCIFCLKEFEAKQHGNKTCSKECSSLNRSKKMSENRKGKPAWNSGKTGIYSEITKQAMGAKNLNKKLTREHREKITKGLLTHYTDHEGPNKDRVMPIEQKRLISKSLNAIPEKEKLEINLRRANTGHITYWQKSQEERDRISLQTKHSLIKYTNNEVWEVLDSYGLKTLEELPRNDERSTFSGNQMLICKCGTQWAPRLADVIKGGTRTCGCEKSFVQKEISDFIRGFLGDVKIVINSKPEFMRSKELGIDYKQELDIFIPEKKVAIEFHGLVWHSRRPLHEKDQTKIYGMHRNKYLMCKLEDIRLIQIFEDEWQDKKDIVKSMIKNSFGLPDTKLNARDCKIKELNRPERREFFNSNHIAGDVGARKAYGLYYKNELVTAISFRNKTLTPYNNTIEIARFASKLFYSVRGGFSKLLKFAESWIREVGYRQILTYADSRFGSGKVYLKCGFDFKCRTKPNLFYEKGGIRESRQKHKKKNNPDFIALFGDTDTKQNHSKGWYEIYDAGSEVYTKQMSPKN